MTQAKRKHILELSLSKRILKNCIEIGVICFSVTAIFIFIALLKFSPEDPAWSHVSSSNIVQNKTGPLGAWLADMFLYLFGYLGYLFPFVMVYGGWGVFKAIRSKAVVNYGYYVVRLVGFAMILIGSCSLAWLYFYAGDGLPVASGGAGGVIGNVFGNAIFDIFGVIGSTLFLLTILLVGTTLLTDLSWVWLIDFVGNRFFKLLDFMVGLWELRLDRKLGKQAKHERDATVKIEKKKIKNRTPVRIEPQISDFKLNDRVEEKQTNLFDSPDELVLPPLDLLIDTPITKEQYSRESLEVISRQIELKLNDFGVDAEVVGVLPGPVVTRFEIQLAAGVKSSRVMNLAKDMARSLSVVSVRVVDIIPGKSVIGLEFPNEHRQLVALGDIFKSKEYGEMSSKLTIGLGKDISGKPVFADIEKMPHLLVAGTTGSGKSVALNTMILSLLYKATAHDLRLIMIDPKMLELSVYEGIPHLLSPVVTDMKDASNALRWCVTEMERRYQLMASAGVRNIDGYNRKIKEPNGTEEKINESSDPQLSDVEQATDSLEHIPYIVVIIDELADMMMVASKQVEELIARLAQKARASGIHLILATQRPSVDVITGLIKANIPSRIAFQVSSKIDSRTILDQSGAETLLGHGDMLYLPAGNSTPTRVHGAFVDDHEIHAIVKHIKSLGEPNYNDDVMNVSSEANGGAYSAVRTDADAIDPLYDEAVKIVTETRKASISYVQRRLRIGYNRAARIIEEMERNELVSTANANGNREILAAPPPPVTD